MWLNAEPDTRRLYAFCQGLPLAHVQNNAEMRDGDVMPIHRIMRRNAARRRIQMCDNLVAEKIEIDPLVGRPPFGAAHDAPVKMPRFGKIVDRKSEMEGT
jgi:hypothetical protein